MPMCSLVTNLKESSSIIAVDDDEELSMNSSPPRDQSVNGDSVWIDEKEIKERTMRKRNRAAAGRSVPPHKQRTTSTSHSVDYIVVSLDNDVLPQILERLLTKSVTRFKTACKSWYSLISSEQFRRLHTLRCHKPPPSLILAMSTDSFNPRLYYSNPITETSEKLRIIPFNIDFIDCFQILSCSNGLMLLRLVKDIHCYEYYIYNPATKQSKKISFPHHDDKFIGVQPPCLVFDPSKSPHYKVVCIRTNESHRYQIIEVFDSESGTWRVCVEPFFLEFGLISACVECKSLIYLFSQNYIFYFDISKNVSQLVTCQLPERAKTASYGHFYDSCPIQEFNGSIYYSGLLVDDPGTLTARACLWQLQVNGDDLHNPKWLLKYQLEVHPLPGLYELRLSTIVMETSTLLIHHVPRECGKAGSPGKIVAYNFLDRSYKELLDLEPRMSCVMVYQFGGTLAVL